MILSLPGRPRALQAPANEGPYLAFRSLLDEVSRLLRLAQQCQRLLTQVTDGGMYGVAPAPPQPGYNYQPASAAQAAMNNGGNYGPVYYNIQNAGYAGMALTEQRKRQHDNLDAFFGDVKRRQLDPTQYYDLGAQFGGMQNMPMFADGGYHHGYQNGFQSGLNQQQQQQQHNAFGGGTATATMAPAPVPNFDVNFSNMKTKNDLLSIDQFLEQLQKTVYEHSTNVVNRDINRADQPLVQATYTDNVDPNLPMRGDSPPGPFSATASSTTDNTAGLTPGSQMSSHSPASVHSNHATSYPSLPSVAALQSQQMGGFIQQPSGVPPNGLGNAYEDTDRIRRHSGAYLQRAKPGSPQSPRSNEDNSGSSEKDLKKEARDTPMHSPTDQSLSVMEPPAKPNQGEGRDGSNGPDERLEGWVQNMRTIEMLRKYINQKLQLGEFEDSSSPASSEKEHEGNTTPKAEESSRDYDMEDIKAVAYPSLPQAA